MATVNGVSLSIKKGKGRNRREVTVSYTLCFTSCEILAGSVFHEKVTLWGEDDTTPDDKLCVLSRACVKATTPTLKRTLTQSISRSILDEDPDVVLFGLRWARQDKIYARVDLTPFSPRGSSGCSNSVKGQFGAAGDD